MFTVFTTKTPLDITFTVKVGDKMRKVSFVTSALYGTKGESLFIADAEVAEAMKKHPWYGVHFFVKEEVKANNSNVEKDNKPKTIEDELRNPETAVYDETVTTKTMAVAYIQGMFDENFTSTTVEDMKREAARKWNIIFKNWGK